ncbi:MAG TPA: hypothetical protein V6D12_14070 [Candidatus Obscuribacterales bacterium]
MGNQIAEEFTPYVKEMPPHIRDIQGRTSVKYVKLANALELLDSSKALGFSLPEFQTIFSKSMISAKAAIKKACNAKKIKVKIVQDGDTVWVSANKA